jgi:hypothetical protein
MTERKIELDIYVFLVSTIRWWKKIFTLLVTSIKFDVLAKSRVRAARSLIHEVQFASIAQLIAQISICWQVSVRIIVKCKWRIPNTLF